MTHEVISVMMMGVDLIRISFCSQMDHSVGYYSIYIEKSVQNSLHNFLRALCKQHQDNTNAHTATENVYN